jgi:hypothetical protein
MMNNTSHTPEDGIIPPNNGAIPSNIYVIPANSSDRRLRGDDGVRRKKYAFRTQF